MSRLKRQRLGAEGQDRVTASSEEAGGLEPERVSQKAKHRQTKQQQGRSLFVRSLPVTTTTESLTNFFSQFFPLKHATVVVDTATKKCKGYGFVTFADAEDARSAKESFDLSLFEGQKIKVEIAEPRHRQTNDGGSTNPSTATSRPSRQKSEFQPPPKLIVRNLPWTIKEPDQLATLFRSYGKVKHATMPKKKPGLSAGYGFVVLRGRKNAERAMEGVNGKEIEGRTLAVDWAVEKELWETLQTGTQEVEVQDQGFNESTPAQVRSIVETNESDQSQVIEIAHSKMSDSDREGGQEILNEDQDSENESAHRPPGSTSSTLFIRNLPFDCMDETLQKNFRSFGPLRYARVVLDSATERSKGTGFVSFYNQEEADACLREAPRTQPSTGPAGLPKRSANPSSITQSLLEDTSKDRSGRYTIDGRVLQVSRAVDRREATRLTFAGNNLRDARDKDRRRLYLLSEGTVPSDTPLYGLLSATEKQMRDDSARQRQSLIRSNPSLHLSLTRLSVRNLPYNITSKELKALAREAAVGFAKDVQTGVRKQLSKEELSRGGEEMREAEKARKAKGKGIVKQAKVVFEGREGGKVTEESGAGRSRGYGFIEYCSHRWALMGLRWLNGHGLGPGKGAASVPGPKERKKRLIVEFAIENAQVVGRRHEREAKARERSKLISEKREKGEIAPTAPKPLIKDQLMAKTRKGMKRKRGSTSESFGQRATAVANVAAIEPEKATKRQQIIGRKRMMRRSRNQPA